MWPKCRHAIDCKRDGIHWPEGMARITRGSAQHQLFDFVDGMAGQVLGYIGDDLGLDVASLDRNWRLYGGTTGPGRTDSARANGFG